MCIKKLYSLLEKSEIEMDMIKNKHNSCCNKDKENN